MSRLLFCTLLVFICLGYCTAGCVWGDPQNTAKAECDRTTQSGERICNSVSNCTWCYGKCQYTPATPCTLDTPSTIQNTTVFLEYSNTCHSTGVLRKYWSDCLKRVKDINFNATTMAANATRIACEAPSTTYPNCKWCLYNGEYTCLPAPLDGPVTFNLGPVSLNLGRDSCPVSHSSAVTHSALFALVFACVMAFAKLLH